VVLAAFTVLSRHILGGTDEDKEKYARITGIRADI
jgi:hypothetical protein